ncbi:MAG: hypothetical protein EU541_01350 [Promethearchaeota archaeon]|nr:MAG: hypothetical protein EU541_01350 [Candidatus Lokiarchaeota archaeon]
MSEHNSSSKAQMCHFCDNNREIAFYCEDCQSSCCSDCLSIEKSFKFFCGDCNSKNIEIKESGDKKICKDCGSENIKTQIERLNACPECHSTNIKNIYQKKREQESRFLELIKSSLLFIKPFKEVFKELNTIKEKIKKARDPPIICYHFPKMESELISLYELLKYIEKSLREKINMYFHHLALNKESFFNIHLQPNSNVRVMENILETLAEGHDSIEEFIGQKIRNINEEIEGFNKKLKFIEKITSYFNEYKQFLHLAEEEKAVYAISAKLSNRHDSRDIFKASKGILFITSLDLSFVNIYGIINKKESLIFKAPVNDLVKIEETGRLFKKLYIEFPYGDYEFSLSNSAISRVVEYILLARNFDETAPFDRLAAQKLHNMEIDFSKLNSFIEEGINSFFSLKCKINTENDESTLFENDLHRRSQYPSFNRKNSSFDNNPSDSQTSNPQTDFYDYPESREKSILMKKLMKANGSRKFFTEVNKNASKYMDYDSVNQSSPSQKNGTNSNFCTQDFTVNHISKFFDSNIKNQAQNGIKSNKIGTPRQYSGENRRNKFNVSNTDLKNMKELHKMLQKKRFNILEALENLKNDFYSDKIRKEDFFPIFRKIQQDLDSINNQLETLKNLCS